MKRAVLVYTTWPSIVEAERAGRAIVEQKLAACVNILPGMISHYRWQGKIERAEEAVMLVKTRASLAGAGGRRGQGAALLRGAGDHGVAGREPGRGLSSVAGHGKRRLGLKKLTPASVARKAGRLLSPQAGVASDQ